MAIAIISRRRREGGVRQPAMRVRTEAEIALADAFAATRGEGAAPARAAREEAFVVFDRQGLPNRRIEAWHYTDMRGALRNAYPLADKASGRLEGSRIVIVDGAAPEGLAQSAWPPGVTIRRLHEALTAADAAMIASIYPSQGGADAMVALNAALARDGVVIEIAPHAQVAAPLELLFVSGDGAPRADVSRCVVLVGEGASATIVETHESSAPVQRNSAFVFKLAAGATADHIFIADRHAADLHVATLLAEIGRDATMNSFALVAGGKMVRRQCFAHCGGERAKAAFRGVSLLSGDRHADTTLVIEHDATHGESRELFKHILSDEATGVFQGKVVVRHGAQKTDGGMKSQALLLSDDAAMYNKPELEIFADDVVCGHGATVGQIDADQLFYLMARGLPRVDAEALLIEGFAREAFEFVGDEALRQRLDDALASWLARRSS